MTVPPYMISSVMLEEHRHNIERGMPNPDWPDAVPATRVVRVAALRQRVSQALFALADRLEPADRAHGAWASESMH